MLKMLITLFSILFYVNTYADQMCYDEAIFELSRTQNEVKACNTALPTVVYERIMLNLESNNPIGHFRRIKKSIRNLDKLMYSDIYGHGLENNKCLKKIFNIKRVRVLKAKLLDAIIQC